MNLYLRLLMVMLRTMAGEKLHYSNPAESRFRVLPHDLDAFGHMNNGRYLQIMDVARTEWMMRTGVIAALRQNRWAPLLGGGFVRFRYSLRLFQSYSVHTRLLGWDGRWFYLEHGFVDQRDRHVSVGVTRAAIRDKDRWVCTHKVAETVHPGAQSPEIPGYVLDWMGVEAEMFRNAGDRTAQGRDEPLAPYGSSQIETSPGSQS
ncbi:MAG: acyl-CoA thioesterase [Xanthomonadales bacterium]|nr:acyl-CoA thioesterase [Xanthomonadales bacterium]